MEVILAMAILMTAVAILGELMRFGMRNAAAARDKTKAALFCESKLAEIVAGAIPADAISGAPVDEQFDSGNTDWTYSIEVLTLDQTGLAAVTVTVRNNVSDNQKPTEVSLTRWIADPAGTTTETETETETTDTSQSSGTSTSPTSGTAGAGGTGGTAGAGGS